MDDFVFLHGKYKGKTYKYVRINHTDYFIYLLSQPAGKVYNEFEFIKYCIHYLETDSSPPPPPKKDYDQIIYQLCKSFNLTDILLTYNTSDKEYKMKYNYESQSYDAWDRSFPEYKFCLDTIEKLITKINDNTPYHNFAKKVIIKHPNGDKILEEL